MAIFNNLYHEFGLHTVLNASRNVHLIILLKSLRLFSFSSVALINAIFLKSIGYDESMIGLLFTVTLVGDLTTTFIISMFADKILGRRLTLFVSSIIMSFTGLYWTFCTNKNNYKALLIVSFLGTITPTGKEVGCYLSVEASGIAQLVTSHNERSDIYSWYSVFSSLASALGFVTTGYLIKLLTNVYDYAKIDAYRFIYLMYSAIGCLMAISCLFLTDAVEIERVVVEDITDAEAMLLDENTPILHPENVLTTNINGEQNNILPENQSFLQKLLPQLPFHVLMLVINLSLLFGLDSLASSLAGKSWISFFFNNKFAVPSQKLGNIFFGANLASSVTGLMTTSLVKRIGPIKTMVFTHLPSSILLILLPLPSSWTLTVILFVARALTQNMDNTPKKVFLATIIKPSERTLVLSWIQLVKTIAGTIGPSITGVLSLHKSQWIAFVIAGSLKVLYDIAIFVVFLKHNEKRIY
ncbi:related to Staphylococcus multidrug resistance protein [Saccharomycodes ludwigii]|uniref:Related to Staphylococcus multidrug resistance protein n=1 Tax=Saccharomycodes ludwigii TaxID=36035 RepID=A0A376BBM8_9ASCO|nr:hypothetical protein SCDLUD_004630 [Saccharomycodes ludwigii]KAH3899200.1 hypothetical protein SCDLUD_004630 [Saccharomycodes ludwigii]SSD61989.1 related to Staphylococcus multidrug resistance protein [Saccharomycodes ludwigii]